MWVYVNNQFLQDQLARISIFDRGFLFGDGVFETLRIYRGHPKFFPRHLTRLQQSCEWLGLPIPPPQPSWEGVVRELIERNALEHALIRITISRGIGGQGPDPSDCSQPTIVIFPRPLPQLTQAQRERGVNVAMVGIRRPPPSAFPSHVKSLNYLDSILAKREAHQAQAFDAILLNTDGHLAECSTSNIFFVKDQCLCTPSLQCGILPGITRGIVLELARRAGITTQEGRYYPEELMASTECFLTNTGVGVLPVGTIEGRPFDSATGGSVTRTIQESYEKCLAKIE